MMMKNYGDKSYWDDRYEKDPHPFEWYQTYATLRHLIQFDNLVLPENRNVEDSDVVPFPQKNKCRVMILGCGTSRLGEDMVKDGWTGEIVNIDFSSVVISTVKARYNKSLDKRNASTHKGEKKLSMARFQNMTFQCADVTKRLPYADETFDLIVCKGTMDSILCSNGATLKSNQMMNECHRLLNKKHGILFVVSFGAPEDRLAYFENEENQWWDTVDVQKVPKRRLVNSSIHSVNVSKKREEE